VKGLDTREASLKKMNKEKFSLFPFSLFFSPLQPHTFPTLSRHAPSSFVLSLFLFFLLFTSFSGAKIGLSIPSLRGTFMLEYQSYN